MDFVLEILLYCLFQGCFQILLELLEENSTILIGVMSGILVLEVSGDKGMTD